MNVYNPLRLQFSKLMTTFGDHTIPSRICGDPSHLKSEAADNFCGKIHIWFLFTDPKTGQRENYSLPNIANVDVSIAKQFRASRIFQVADITISLNKSVFLPLEKSCHLSITLPGNSFQWVVCLPAPGLLCQTSTHSKITIFTMKHMENLNRLMHMEVSGKKSQVKSLVHELLRVINQVYDHSLGCDCCGIQNGNVVTIPRFIVRQVLQSFGFPAGVIQGSIPCESLIHSLSISYSNLLLSPETDVHQFVDSVEGLVKIKLL